MGQYDEDVIVEMSDDACPQTEEAGLQNQSAKKKFSRIGIAMSLILGIGTVLQVLLLVAVKKMWGTDSWLLTSSWGLWILSFVPLYAVAMPVGILAMRGMPAERPQEAKLGGGNFFIFLCVFFFFTYCGNILGTVLSSVLSGGNASNSLTEYAMDTNPLKLLVMVVLAPLLEEYICRRMIIDRTRKYGERVAVFFSALLFGLFHGNLYQFFYAFAGGLLLGYVYIRTGRLRYPVLLHSLMNFSGAVVAPLVLMSMDMEALSQLDPTAPTEVLMELYARILPGMLLYLAYLLIIVIFFIVGLVLFVLKCKKLIWKPAQEQLPAGICFKTVYLNIGVIVFVLLCAGMMFLSLQ